MNKLKFYILIFFTLTNLLIQAQQVSRYSFMTEEEREMIKNQLGELSFSQTGLPIDELAVYKDHVFITSNNLPGVVRIYDSNHLLVDEMKFKNEDKNAYAGLYKSNGQLFYNSRPVSSEFYSILLKKGKWSKSKIKMNSGDRKVYFGKKVKSDQSELVFYDSYGTKHADTILGSYLLLRTNVIKDTLLMHEKNAMTILHPYGSWSFDITYNNKHESFFVQDFSDGSIHIYDKSGNKKLTTSLASLNQDKGQIIYSFFGGNYKYHSKIFIDDISKEVYLYFGVKHGSKTQGKFYKWDAINTNWDSIQLTLPNSKDKYPFIDILDIHDNQIYFPMKIDQRNEGVYVSGFKD